MRPLGPAAAGPGSEPPRRGRGQAMLTQPTPEGPVGGDFNLRSNPVQFDLDAGRPPTRVAAAEIQDRLQQRRGRAGPAATAVIAGSQADVGLAVGLGPPGEVRQIAGRAHGQTELPGDLGRGGPDADHPGDGQS